MLASLFSGIFGKYILGAVGVIGLVGVLTIGYLYIQIQAKDIQIIQQEQTIKDQKTRIDTLQLVNDIKDKAEKTLTDRLNQINVENQDLQDQIEKILKEPPENDGPVAPILRGIFQ